MQTMPLLSRTRPPSPSRHGFLPGSLQELPPFPGMRGHARQGHPSAAALLTFDLNVIVQIGRERGAVPSESELCLASVSPCVTKLVYSA